MSVLTAAERLDVADTVGRLIADLAPSKRVHELAAAPDTFDRNLWNGLAEVGALALLVPEAHGGLGGSLSDVAFILEKLAAGLSVVPYVSSAVLATSLLASRPDTDLARTWLPRLATGEARATVAVGSEPLAWAFSAPGAYVVQGDLTFVGDAAGANVILAAGRSGRGEAAWFGLTPHQVRDVAPIVLHDPLRRAASLRVEATVGEDGLLAVGAGAVAVGAQVLDVAACALAADSVGSAQHVLERTVEYVSTREQFGHPIGTFQAVKHRCADMFIDVVAARAAVQCALEAVEGRLETESAHDAELLSRIAKNQATSRHVAVAGAAVQLHGGVGFTWEYGLHFHLKRALFNRASHPDELAGSRDVWAILGVEGGE